MSSKITRLLTMVNRETAVYAMQSFSNTCRYGLTLAVLHLLVVAGVWIGVHWAHGTLSIEPWARRAAVPAVMIAGFCFTIRRMVAHGLELGGFEFLFDKWHLGPLRMLDFGAVPALLIVSQPITKQAAIRPLVLLGQFSLQVFCVHLLFCLAGLTLLGNASMLSGLKQIALLTMTFTAMLITAMMFSKSEAKNERQTKHKSPVDQVPLGDHPSSGTGFHQQ